MLNKHISSSSHAHKHARTHARTHTQARTHTYTRARPSCPLWSVGVMSKVIGSSSSSSISSTFRLQTVRTTLVAYSSPNHRKRPLRMTTSIGVRLNMFVDGIQLIVTVLYNTLLSSSSRMSGIIIHAREVLPERERERESARERERGGERNRNRNSERDNEEREILF